MVDYKFEFQYTEAKLPSLRQISGSVSAGRCVVLCVLLAVSTVAGLIL